MHNHDSPHLGSSPAAKLQEVLRVPPEEEEEKTSHSTAPLESQHLTPSMVEPSRPLALLEENSIIFITLMEQEHLVYEMRSTCRIREGGTHSSSRFISS